MAAALHIYLQDHLAGATFGLELVRRCQRNNEGSELAEPLAKLTAEIAEDRRTLQAIMRDVGVEASRTKVAAGWTLEKVRRLKPNGKLFEYTPLARLVELESLAIGISGKKAMWQASRMSPHRISASRATISRRSPSVPTTNSRGSRHFGSTPHARPSCMHALPAPELRPPSSGRPWAEPES